MLIEQHDFLEAVGQTLSDKNGVIFKLEKERNEAETLLEDCRSIFMKKRRAELENKISIINKQIETHKSEFAQIVLRNGFQNVSDFYKRLYASREAWRNHLKEQEVKNTKKEYYSNATTYDFQNEDKNAEIARENKKAR